MQNLHCRYTFTYTYWSWQYVHLQRGFGGSISHLYASNLYSTSLPCIIHNRLSNMNTYTVYTKTGLCRLLYIDIPYTIYACIYDIQTYRTYVFASVQVIRHLYASNLCPASLLPDALSCSLYSYTHSAPLTTRLYILTPYGFPRLCIYTQSLWLPSYAV